MDSLGGGLGNLDLTKLSDRDKQELQQFAMNEQQKARIQSCMSCRHDFLCFSPKKTPHSQSRRSRRRKKKLLKY